MELVNSNVINISDEDLETMLDSGDGLIENPGFEYISDIDSNFEASGIELSDADSDTDVEFIKYVPYLRIRPPVFALEPEQLTDQELEDMEWFATADDYYLTDTDTDTDTEQ